MMTHRQRVQREDGHKEPQNERQLLKPTLERRTEAERKRNKLSEGLDILEEQFGSGTRQYDSEDGTRP